MVVCLCLDAVLLFGRDIEDLGNFWRAFHFAFRSHAHVWHVSGVWYDLVHGCWGWLRRAWMRIIFSEDEEAFQKLEKVSRFTAYAWFTIFTVLLVIILLNMLLAIIMDNYMIVKKRAQSLEFEALVEELLLYWLKLHWCWQERVKLDEIWATFVEDAAYNRKAMCQSGRLISPSFLMDMVPGIPSSQAERTLVNSWMEHLKEIKSHELEPPFQVNDAHQLLSGMEAMTRKIRNGLFFAFDVVHYFDSRPAFMMSQVRDDEEALAEFHRTAQQEVREEEEARAEFHRTAQEEEADNERSVVAFVEEQTARLSAHVADALAQSMEVLEKRQARIEEREESMSVAVRHMHGRLLQLQGDAKTVARRLEKWRLSSSVNRSKRLVICVGARRRSSMGSRKLGASQTLFLCRCFRIWMEDAALREQKEAEERIARMARNARMVEMRRQLDELKRKEVGSSALKHRERGHFVVAQVAQKRAALEQEQLERQMALQRALDHLKVEAPRDLQRLHKVPERHTAEAYSDPLVCVTRGPAAGFDEQRLMADARYKLSAALQAAGLYSTKAGQEALARVAAPKPAQPHLEADEILSELRRKAETGDSDLPWGDCLERSWQDGVLRVTRSYTCGSSPATPEVLIQERGEFPYSAHPCSGVGGTGGLVWRGALALAEHLGSEHRALEAQVILEIGAGCGLASWLQTGAPKHRGRIAGGGILCAVARGLFSMLVRRVLQILNAIYFGAPKRTSKGLYLYGSVGCGKTMSMDIFFSALKSHPSLRVQRKHFHEFLYEIQRLLHKIKSEDLGFSGRPGHLRTRAVFRLDWECNVLESGLQIQWMCCASMNLSLGSSLPDCQLMQDCCILLPLFNALFRRGVTIIATSNRAPEELYSDGLNRQVYLPPFLQLLNENCKVHHMQSLGMQEDLRNQTDYRAMQYENSPDAGVFCWPPRPDFVDSWFQKIANTGAAGQVEVAYSRTMPVPVISICGGVARFAFSDLCERHLAADDYNAICSQFHTILIDAIPRLTVDQHNEARRLTLLIDCCYEHHTRVIASMDGPPEEILGGLAELQKISMSSLGSGEAGCGDSDSAASSSGVLSAISRIKTSLKDRADAGEVRTDAAALFSGEGLRTDSVLESEIQRARSHGGDISIWRQDAERSSNSSSSTLRSLPQVSKGWDDRRRISQFTWESTDPTSEQQAIKGVFVAAVASLKESGFAVDRAISRLREMQTVAFQDAHRAKHGL
eukprot:g20238.t1